MTTKKKPASPITPALIEKIAGMTYNNDHTGSILTLAKALKLEREVEALTAIRALHDYFNEMPYELSKIRNVISARVLDDARRRATPAAFKRLHDAF